MIMSGISFWQQGRKKIDANHTLENYQFLIKLMSDIFLEYILNNQGLKTSAINYINYCSSSSIHRYYLTEKIIDSFKMQNDSCS